jgi:hypothetical protein
MGNKLYVGNLPYSVRDSDLEQAFGQFGSVTSAKVMMERDTGRSKGFGFVEMGSDAEAQAAIQGMNGQPLGGRGIVVNEARPMEPRPPRSGGGAVVAVAAVVGTVAEAAVVVEAAMAAVAVATEVAVKAAAVAMEVVAEVMVAATVAAVAVKAAFAAPMARVHAMAAAAVAAAAAVVATVAATATEPLTYRFS